MKKSLLLISLGATLLSCSNDDSPGNCQAEKDKINQYYDNQVQQVRDNPSSSGINYRQIGLLNEERNKKLSNACN
jgi:hypothetical protein